MSDTNKLFTEPAPRDRARRRDILAKLLLSEAGETSANIQTEHSDDEKEVQAAAKLRYEQAKSRFVANLLNRSQS
jgi:hypothetical protein